MAQQIFLRRLFKDMMIRESFMYEIKVIYYAFNPDPAFSRVLAAIERKYDYNIVFKGCDHYQYNGKMQFEKITALLSFSG